MGIVGVNFSKLLVEKKKAASGKITINNNISIKDVEESDLSLGKTKQKGVKLVFQFTSNYAPDIAEILIGGEVLYLDEEAKAKKILEEWKKDKKIAKEVITEVLNAALMKCNIEALLLSKEANLPPPLNLPKIEVKKKENYIG